MILLVNAACDGAVECYASEFAEVLSHVRFGVVKPAHHIAVAFAPSRSQVVNVAHEAIEVLNAASEVFVSVLVNHEFSAPDDGERFGFLFLAFPKYADNRFIPCEFWQGIPCTDGCKNYFNDAKVGLLAEFGLFSVKNCIVSALMGLLI